MFIHKEIVQTKNNLCQYFDLQSNICLWNYILTACGQIYGGSAEGRILNGNSPCELIECLTESIGRPPKLPDWIISGPVVGMQGGTATVRNVWEELNRYEVPVSAFWLQVNDFSTKEHIRM